MCASIFPGGGLDELGKYLAGAPTTHVQILMGLFLFCTGVDFSFWFNRLCLLWIGGFDGKVSSPEGCVVRIFVLVTGYIHSLGR